jgi:TRAP-type C4-dicarboxylate transport system permease small subunit
MKALYRFLDSVHRVTVKVLGAFSSLVLAILVFDVLWGVFTRFVMGSQARWTEEVAIILLVWVSFLGAAIAYADNAHLGVDYVVEKFHPSIRELTHRIVHFTVLVFAVYGMVWGGAVLMGETNHVTAALNFPQRWVYFVIPLSGAFFVLFALHAILSPVSTEAASSTENLAE